MGGLAGINVDVKDLGGIFSGVGTLAKDIRAAITGKSVLDPNKQAEIEAKLIELESAVMQAQSRVNEIEAASPSLFIAGWRPATGWLCVTGLAWQVFIWPIWVWVSKLYNIPTPPNIETAVLITLLIGMLGLGTLRTVEKRSEVQDKH